MAEKRSFQWHWDADGMLVLQVRMDGEAGAALLADIESLAERDARRDRAAAKKAAAKAARPAAPNGGDTSEGPEAFPRERMSARAGAARWRN